MGRVLEHHTKELLAQWGISVPRGRAVATSRAAANVATGFGGRAVVKALVPVGRRGKAGAVRLAGSAAEARAEAAALLRSYVHDYPVRHVLVEEPVAIARELYLSLTLDREARLPRILLSAHGGIEVEEIARDDPDALISATFDPRAGLVEYRARELWRAAGVGGALLPRLAQMTVLLARAFTGLDATLLEINPLAETVKGDLVAVGAVLSVDDAALFRHPELGDKVAVASEKVWRPLTAREEAVNALNAAEPYRGSARYLELEGGDVGFLCGGGGASLVLFDALVRAGGRPANYSEFGGNPTETKVAGLARLVLEKPGVRGLFVAHNITNNTQVDVVARGVVRALEAAGISAGDFPVVAREVGLHDTEGRAIFEAAGVRYLGQESTLGDAARAMVAAMRERYGGEQG
ncbi:MAG TPA: ATP-grasp domain-containing protein [Thermomicrobiaceae bacterium]|nr:ATP-grasp domain-containing protein [Thermomicrobiaceae bacterium]